MMVPKSFRLQDWAARALHDSADSYQISDGDLLRRIVLEHLEREGINLSDYMFATNPSRNRR